MCGICGGIGFDRESILGRMSECLSHRGPDSTGNYRDGTVMLASQRLSVIDVEGGDQPVYNEDGDVVVVYNGEIYNYRNLRAELRERGHRFTTRSDTEVLVHGYEEYGPSMFERLNGMFAVALWDATDRRLFLARDRTGIKPLYHARTDDGILFASEPKSILRSGVIEPSVDTEALEYFLDLRYSPSHRSLFRGIETVRPGTYLEIVPENEGWRIAQRNFWKLSSVTIDPPEDPVSAVRRALRRAIERQLDSDVPIGFYLSGGLDTSSVVAIASELSNDPIHTFCMGFDDAEWDERSDARIVADHFDTIHHEIEIEREFMRDFPQMIWHADEPKRNLYPYYVAREMAEHVTVALGGLGADELFGGYVYRYQRLGDLENLRSSLPMDMKDRLKHAADQLVTYQIMEGDLSNDEILKDMGVLADLDDDAALYVLLNSTDVIGDMDMLRERVFGETLDNEVNPADWIRELHPCFDESLREQSLRWDFTVKLPDDFLLVEDRMSMAHSLESRVPFLDNELVNLAFSIPFSDKFSGTSGPMAGKAILRHAMHDTLPAAVFRKDKQGFTMPTFPFVHGELLDHAREILDDPHIVRKGFIDAAYLKDLIGRKPDESLLPHYKLLWKLVALEIWYQMYIIDDVAGPKEIDYYA